MHMLLYIFGPLHARRTRLSVTRRSSSEVKSPLKDSEVIRDQRERKHGLTLAPAIMMLSFHMVVPVVAAVFAIVDATAVVKIF